MSPHGRTNLVRRIINWLTPARFAKTNLMEASMSDPQLGTPDLGSIIPSATARNAIYIVFVLAGLVLGGIQAWCGAAFVPGWFPHALDLYAYAAIPIAGLAAANKTPRPKM